MVEECGVLWQTGRRLQLSPAGLPRDDLLLQPQTARAGIRWDVQAIADCLQKGDKRVEFLQAVDSSFEKAKPRSEALREDPTLGSLGRLQEGNRKNVLWPPPADGATSEVKDVTSSLLQDGADWDRRLSERDQHMMEQLTGLEKGVSETMEGRMSDLEKGCKICGWFSKKSGWKRSWNPTTKKLSSPRRSTGSSWRCKEKLTRDGGTVWTEKTDRITFGIALRCGETQCETL